MSITRLTGMATGMDTDTTVKQLMKPYQMRVDKLTQNKQLVQWKQDAYRDIMSDLNSFKSNYFEKSNPDNYMLSNANYAGFNVSAVDSGTIGASTGVEATANVGAVVGNYKIDFTGGNLAASAGVRSNGIIKTNATPSLNAVGSTKLSDIGMVNTTTININYDNGNGIVPIPKATINITPEMTLSELVQAINTGTSSYVVASFSELTGKFTLKTTNTGANTTLSIETTDSGSNLLEKLNLGAAGATTANQGSGTYGILPKDLNVLITPPGGSPTLVTKSSNEFTADGITYNFLSDKDKTGSTPLISNINITSNVQKSYDKIKGFIDKYNETIDKIKTKLQEKTQKAYLPLTDEEKKAMSADDIKAWEVKAKQGLLRNDPILSNMLTSMRSAFYTGVAGAGVTLSEIGLSTSDDYTQGGKIFIDETKLKDALQNKGTQVASIFSKPSSSISYYSPELSASDRTLRNSEEGIFQRINDIIQDNTRTTGSKKGMLLEKAGIKGNYTEYNNLLTTDMIAKQKYIDGLKDKMSIKETLYYNQFAKLEVAMNKMNSQSSWITQSLSGGK